MKFTFTSLSWGNTIPELTDGDIPDGWDWDRFVRASGFDPDDEENTIVRLGEDLRVELDGEDVVYPAGTIVVTGQTTENCEMTICTPITQ